MTSYTTLIILSGLVIFSYLFDLIGGKTKIPSVILLMCLGIIIKQVLDYFGFHPFDEFTRIHAGASHNNSAYHFASALHQGGDTKCVADSDVANVTDVDGNTGFRSDNDVLDIGDGFNQAEAAHDGPRTVRFQDISSDVLVAAEDRVHYPA